MYDRYFIWRYRFMVNWVRISGILCLFLSIGLLSKGHAQEFPFKPIRIVVPWAPGGNVDITARTLAPVLSEVLGQQVIVENKPGAGGMIGSSGVAKSAADGYTLLLGSSGSVTVAPAIAKSPPYDPIKDLSLIGPIHAVPIVLTASAKSSIKHFQDFVSKAKIPQSPLSVASAGTGSSNHLAIELLARKAGLQLNHVPYKGSGPALTDLVGGQVETMMDQLTASMPFIRDARIRPLAVSSRKRSNQLPEVPTLIELGVADYEVLTFTALFAPAGLPGHVREKLTNALRTVLARQSVRERFATLGVDMIELDRPSFEQYLASDFNNWRTVAKEANISMN
jgi:tripartite-type tricarboxylate transporter receptor subunit TctC